MIQFRWLTREVTNGHTAKSERVLQFRELFSPVLIASGDIVLSPNKIAPWQDIPEEYAYEVKP